MATITQKRHIKQAFLTANVRELEEALSAMSLGNAISLVISVCYSHDESVRTKAVQLFGRLMVRLASQDMEAVRSVMRRLMWSLNDESGGIGWGAPEAMAEAMALHQGVAQEYAHMLLSYVWHDGNYLEYLPLRQGALKGIARLACAWPALMKSLGAEERLREYAADEDDASRQAALKAIACLQNGI
ncbi:MAG: DVU0298 family protein [Dissulfuribacterales bacterium]